MSDEHSLTFKVQLSEKRSTVWITDATIMAGDYWMHEFTDEPVTVAMPLEDAREFHGWLTTVVERNAGTLTAQLAARDAEVARLREALEGSCSTNPGDRDHPCWCESWRLNHSNDCMSRRAALAAPTSGDADQT